MRKHTTPKPTTLLVMGTHMNRLVSETLAAHGMRSKQAQSSDEVHRQLAEDPFIRNVIIALPGVDQTTAMNVAACSIRRRRKTVLISSDQMLCDRVRSLGVHILPQETPLNAETAQLMVA